jgi:pilus assembly protein CpaE
MDVKLNVLLVSRHKATLDQLESVLSKHAGLRLQRKLTVNGHVDPLHEVSSMPDALILHLGEKSQAELESLSARPVDQRPPLIAVGPANDTNLMRLAMQAGARDLLSLPLIEADLLAALQRIARDRRVADGRTGSLIAFMNAKGGCGSTLVACNTAHALTVVSQRSVTLIDLDLQFGAIPVYFDLFPKRGMLQALENIEGLDEAAFRGYLVEHSSGLRILGHASEDALPMQAPAPQHVDQLIGLALRGSEHVIVDLPRRVDAVAATVMEHAQHVVLVVQQSVATVRDATRVMNCLRREMGMSKERIVVAVNRYEKDAPITAEDIRATLACGELSLIPNDFDTVSDCINTGMPLLERARSAAVTRAVVDLHTRLGGNAADRQGLLARTFSGLLKARTS